MAPNPKVDKYLTKTDRWQPEFKALRAILLASDLQEELKWGKPCYTYQNQNVTIFFALKAYCGLGFFKGALMDDPENLLHRQGKNSQAVRMLRYSDAQQITDSRESIARYLREAIRIEKSGQKIDFSEKDNLVYPQELKDRFASDPALEAAFDALTPGRRRAYNLHFSGATQSATRSARIERCAARILEGKGLNDR